DQEARNTARKTGDEIEGRKPESTDPPFNFGAPDHQHEHVRQDVYGAEMNPVRRDEPPNLSVSNSRSITGPCFKTLKCGKAQRIKTRHHDRVDEGVGRYDCERCPWAGWSRCVQDDPGSRAQIVTGRWRVA